MIVYGDPSYNAPLDMLVCQIKARLEQLLLREVGALPTTPPTLDSLRSLLVICGQLEQAAHDEKTTLPYVEALHMVTAHAASAFYFAWSAEDQDATGEVEAALNKVWLTLQDLSPPAVTVNVKLPEGFAFYALYPEQYCASALRWAAEHRGSIQDKVLVVGIRSIGTTLAAVVTATLNASGWSAKSITVRPGGHPFSRQLTLEEDLGGDIGWALVVDEGPGMSGSSMASVAEALVDRPGRTGFSREKICFFPGHSGQPGSAASDSVRRWWDTTPRYVTPLSQVQFSGLALPDALILWAQQVTSKESAPEIPEIVEISGGAWRGRIYNDPSEWPPAYIPFERPKYLCIFPDETTLLFKFEGFVGIQHGKTTAEKAVEQLATLAEGIWTPAPLGHVQGFICTPWVNGRPLSFPDAEPEMLRHLARYIEHAAGPAIPREEGDNATERLAEMLYWNTWESLGEEAAQRTRQWAEAARHHSIEGLPTYGDGHMEPHDWLRTPQGINLKVDSTGHAWDHTVVGRQPVAWDIAACIVEWRLDNRAVATLLRAFMEAGRTPIPPPLLTFYLLAYTAFRTGLSKMCMDATGYYPDEQARLMQAYTLYKGGLAHLLKSPQVVPLGPTP
ncbi:MAG: hypothetical protein M3014_04010 [Chloroflexota bacterium]|nr:hypothetical protein [Chloroflexota bacterium]